MRTNYYENISLKRIAAMEEKLDFHTFASVANMMQIHVYTYSKRGKCHISSEM